MSRFDYRSEDYNRPAGDREPLRRLLVVWTTPRSASTSFTDAMRQVGWGLPIEYFADWYRSHFCARWLGQAGTPEDAAGARAYAEALIDRRRRNGTFGIKVFPEHLAAFRAGFAGRPEPVHHVVFCRRDKLSQTISLVALYMTGKPFEDESRLDWHPRLDRVDERAVVSVFRWLCGAERKWLRRIAGEARAACVISEEFIEDPAGQLRGVASRLALPEPSEADLAAVLAAQTGRYRTDAALKCELRARYGPLLRPLQRDYEDALWNSRTQRR